MDGAAASLSSLIGARVKRERQARHLTLDQLADATGVSRRMIVNVEQGAANPSVAILLRISDALGVGLPSLVAPAESPVIRVSRAGEGAVLWTGEAGGRGVLVAGTQPPDVIELWDWTLGPGDRHDSEQHTPGTKELLQVLEGALVVAVGDQTVSLGVGDALTFDGDQSHSYANQAEDITRFSLAVFEPGVGSGRTDHA